MEAIFNLACLLPGNIWSHDMNITVSLTAKVRKGSGKCQLRGCHGLINTASKKKIVKGSHSCSRLSKFIKPVKECVKHSFYRG